MNAGTSSDLRARVGALLADAGYTELFDALRARIEAVGAPSSVTLTRLSDASRRALADLLGRRRIPESTVRVVVADLDAVLRASRVDASLVEVLETIAGPLIDRRAVRAAGRDRWTALWTGVDADPRVLAHAALGQWVEGLRTDGLLRRLAGDVDAGHALIERALSIVAELPAAGQSLAVFAAACTGDPHALDHGTPLATLVLRAIVQMTGADRRPATHAARRELWAQMGVVCDPLSSDVLVLNLPTRGSGLLERTLAQHAAVGEPLRLTLRALERHAMDLVGDVIHVCENPAVLLAAADTLGAASAPLVCVEGMPGVAADHLLASARAGGAALRFHTDFDWGGMRIGNLLIARHTAAPWRLSVRDYEAGLAATAESWALRGRPVEPVWDTDLAAALTQAGRAVAEEQVLDDLLADLDSGSDSGARPSGS